MGQKKADASKTPHPPHAEYPLRLGNCALVVVLADKDPLEIEFALDDEVDDTESVENTEGGASVTDAQHSTIWCRRTNNKSIGSQGQRSILSFEHARKSFQNRSKYNAKII